MPREKRTKPFNYKALVATAAAVLLVLGIIQVAQGYIDTRGYKERIKEIVKEKTGKDLGISGGVTVSLLPIPTIYLAGVELHDTASNSPVPSLTADMVSIRTSILSLFSGTPEVTHIRFEHPILGLERATDHIIHWDWLNAALLKRLIGNEDNSSIALEINNGQMVYSDRSTDESFDIQAINAYGNVRSGMKGTFTLLGQELQFTAKSSGSGPDGIPLDVKLFTDDKNYAQLAGTIDWSGEEPKIKGQFQLAISNMMDWLNRNKAEEKHSLLDKFTNSAVQDPEQQTSALPFNVTGDWKQEGTAIAVSNMQITGGRSEGKGQLSVHWTDTPVIETKLQLSSLDYGPWQLFLARIFQTTTVAPTEPGYQPREITENPLPRNVQFDLDVKADQMIIGSQQWKNAIVQLKLAEGSVTVNQLHVELPGESSLSLFGIISQASGKGLRFEGSMESEGKSLRQFLTIFDESASELPEAGFGAFYGRANIFLSPEQMRLSEADVKISDLRLGGGLVAYYDENPRLEADVKLKDINFDYFRDNWRKSHADTKENDFFLKFDKGMNFSWLKKLRTTVDFRVSVDQFTFLERKGDNVSFRIFAQDKQFGIYNIRFIYPNDTMEASFSLDMKGDKPAVNMVLNAGEIDTGYFSWKPAKETPAIQTPEESDEEDADKAKEVKIIPQSMLINESYAQEAGVATTPPTPPALPAAVAATEGAAPVPAAAPAAPADPQAKKNRWSQDLIDMSWMEGYNGSFDISIGKLHHNNHLFENLKMRARLDNNLMTFQSLSFGFWQGRCDVTGSIYGGTVPGVSIGFTLYNAELLDMLQSVTERKNISGKISVSGTLATSGVNMLSWVSQSDAKLVFSGRGVNVDGFNAQAVIDTVSVSRTSSDVLNNVPLAIQRGSTIMSIDGNLNVKNGIARTPGITLKSGSIVGNLTGEMQLVPWLMDTSVLFQFPMMTSETVPTMTVRLTGSVDKPSMQTDTASLEAYVAKRITGR